MTTAVNRKSKVKLLPEHIRGPMNALIRSGEMMQKDILSEVHRMCEEAGLPDDAKPSKTSFNRYVKQMEDMGARIHQAREVAEVWTAKLGDAPTSDLSKLLQDFVRTMAFETSIKMAKNAADEDKIIPPKALNQLAMVVQRVEQAAMTSHKVEKEIRAAFAAEAAEKAEKIVKQAGITATTAAEIKKQILGIA